MKVSSKYNFPNLARQFRNEDELAKCIFRSIRTVRRSMSGNRPFEEYEIRRIEEYTGLSREYLLRSMSKC